MMLTSPALSTVVERTLGLRLREQDRKAAWCWIAERARSGRLTVDEWVGQLSGSGPEARREREALTVRLTTGETYFLRDAGVFELLAAHILPELIERRRNERRLRLWSAGCASGEEAYSLAMLLLEQARQLAGWDVRIIGTDIDSAALASACRGVYGDWSFRAIDALRKQRYFRAQGRHWAVTDDLRPLVRFSHLDLLGDHFPDRGLDLADIDLILCRNVFIYMQPEAVATVAGKLAASLADGGYLITGHGELLGHNTHGLHTRVFAASVVLHKLGSPPVTESPANVPVVPLASGATGMPADPVAAVSTAVEPEPAPPPTFEQWMQEAWTCADRGDALAAQAACAAASGIDPLNPWPYYVQAQLAQERGDATQARQLLERVIYLDPRLVAAYLELGGLFEQDGNREAMRRMLLNASRELRKLPPSTLIKPYEASTAADMLAYLEARLDSLAMTRSSPSLRPGIVMAN